ncbi:MAG: M56 family metallopeptidase [Bdellovibrio sp.]
MWKLFFLLLPFVKVLYDFMNGVPRNSILIQQINPFKVQPGFQNLSIGLGGNYWGPIFQAIFTVKDEANNQFSASAGDYLFFWLSNKNPYLPQIILITLVSISTFYFLRRFFEAIRFEVIRRIDRKSSIILAKEKINFRSVEIYISNRFYGTPFTGGVLKPYICIPHETYTKMKSEEVTAIIAHELGHIRKFDVIFTILIQFIGDFFWFIPGYRWLSRQIDQLGELVADQFVTKKGVRGEHLASALITLKEIENTPNNFILYSAFFREKSLLKIRIKSLLGEAYELKERFGWNYRSVRIVFSIWIIKAVMISSLGGNHSITLKTPEDFAKNVSNYLNLK